ncbi:MAG: hypothetical protein R3Y43_01715 [Alphaproteobacteria bacterium]
MSISTTRKVSANTISAKKRNYSLNSGNGSSVDEIDTKNNVLIKDNDSHEENNSYQQETQQEKNKEKSFSSNSVYISNAINVQEEQESKNNNLNNVNIYKKNSLPQAEEEVDKLI